MKKIKITLLISSMMISVLFLCFVHYGNVKSNLMDTEIALPLISIWAYRIAELLLDYFKSVFLIQLVLNFTLLFLIIRQNKS